MEPLLLAWPGGSVDGDVSLWTFPNGEMEKRERPNEGMGVGKMATERATAHQPANDKSERMRTHLQRGGWCGGWFQ